MKKHIVLIEDDLWLADSFRAALQTGGFTVTVCATAHEAMCAVDTRLPDAVVADVLLGDHTSFTLFQELQSYHDTALIPVILCTGVDTRTLTGSFLRAYGIVAVLEKATVTPEQLRHTVFEYVGRTRRVVR